MYLSPNNMNIHKFIDYGNPVIYQKPDYRTSTSRGHRHLLNPERIFVPLKSQVLCQELQNDFNNYQPISHSAKEFQWKINTRRNIREDLAPSLNSVRYLHQFSDKVKGSVPIKSAKCYPLSTKLPPESKLTDIAPPQIEHQWRETHYTNTDGYFPHADPLLSTTKLDYHPHSNYGTARTNLIVRKDFHFNINTAHFVPNSKILKQFPMFQQYDSKIIRDVSKFKHAAFDRIVPRKFDFIPNNAFTTETSSNF